MADKEKWLLEDKVGVAVLLIGILVILFLVPAIPYYIGQGQVLEDWCVSEGGMWLEQDCYVKGEKIELR